MQQHETDYVTPLERRKAIARAIRVARQEAKISQRELARRSGISHSQVSRIEKAEVGRPSYETLDRLSAAMGRDPHPFEYLIWGGVPVFHSLEAVKSGKKDDRLSQFPGEGASEAEHDAWYQRSLEVAVEIYLEDSLFERAKQTLGSSYP